MKKLAILFAFFPDFSFAHGGHTPLPDAAHAVSHAGPLLGAGLICAAVGLAIYQRWLS